ncbi:MlaC/ttg2D family ABC transporter substrate-binding protein [Luteimonas abyssi]|uniref:MlaC/ttg2D family ABC transporter substrate-binding protein n=1 Tax=Luteimonas abyssi TaxID=1247514 RepID=UPI000737B82F|nr:ABC transporter substrate-binding protein [Luteimonas abyssi]
MTRSLIAIAIAAGLFAGVPALAQAQQQPTRAAAGQAQGEPSRLVLENTQRILNALETRRAEFTANRGTLDSFLRDEFDTIFDRDYAARQVLGRHGRGASEADIQLFAQALSESLLSRYGGSLLDFNVRLTPRIRSESELPRGLGVRVASELVRQGGDPVPVDYLMRQSGGQWKVFDVQVEGVSFVSTFRRQFDTELQQKSIRQVANELRSGRLQADADVD